MEISENALNKSTTYFLHENGSQIHEHCANKVKSDDRSINIVLFFYMEIDHRSIIIVLATSSWIHGCINGRTDGWWVSYRLSWPVGGGSSFECLVRAVNTEVLC